MQNMRLIINVARGPNAFLPISEYDLSRVSVRIMRARIFALKKNTGVLADNF